MLSCLHSVSLPEVPLLEVLSRAKAAGYAGVEINAETLPWARPHLTPDATAGERVAVRETARRLGLRLPALGAHIGLVGSDPGGRKAALDFVLGCNDLARDLGIPIVHVLSGPTDDGVSKAQAWPWFAEAVRTATGHAAERGITLAIEAIVGQLFSGVDDYIRLRREQPDVPWRVNFDPSHLIVQDEDPMRVVAELGDEVVNVHLKDGDGRFPDFAFPPLGRGRIDFAALTDALRRTGYDGAMSVEYEAQVFGFEASEDEIVRSGREFLTALRVA